MFVPFNSLPSLIIKLYSFIFCRKTHLLTMDSQMGINSNGFNYWYHNNMLGPYRD